MTALSYHSNKNVVFYKFKCTFILSQIESMLLIFCIHCIISVVRSSEPSFFFINSSHICLVGEFSVTCSELQKMFSLGWYFKMMNDDSKPLFPIVSSPTNHLSINKIKSSLVFCTMFYVPRFSSLFYNSDLGPHNVEM